MSRKRNKPHKINTTPTQQKHRVDTPEKIKAEPTRSCCFSLEALAPLIIRSGRPFDGQSGVDVARVPPPSTVSGAVRTAWARQNNHPFEITLRERAVSGPLLLCGEKVLLPKPADALYFGRDSEATMVRMEPSSYSDGCGSDLPAGLLPLQLNGTQKGKSGTGPQWWALDEWIRFRSGTIPSHADLTKSGWTPPRGDRRTHVAIDNKRSAAESGRLFQTEGLDMGATLNAKGESQSEVRLLTRFSEPLSSTLLHLGGERRMAALHPEPENLWPQPPDRWLEAICQAGGVSLTLITGGLFNAGFRPGWLDKEGVGSPPQAPTLQLKLRAAATERWQPHSGWDLATQRPRPTRKLVPAGAVYWFALLKPESTTPEDLLPLWTGSLCDEEQDRNDGFGLALPAAWNFID